MRFVIQTTCDKKTMTEMVRVQLKTQRRWLYRIILVVYIMIACGCLYFGTTLWIDSKFGLLDIISFLLMLVLLVQLFSLNTTLIRIAKRAIPPGVETIETTFTEEKYVNVTDVSQSHWEYSPINAIYETKEYFVFFFSKQHGQVYDKRGFLEGTPEDFRTFITEITGKPVEYIK